MKIGIQTPPGGLKGLNIEMHYHKKFYFQDVLSRTPRIHPHAIDYLLYFFHESVSSKPNVFLYCRNPGRILIFSTEDITQKLIDFELEGLQETVRFSSFSECQAITEAGHSILICAVKYYYAKEGCPIRHTQAMAVDCSGRIPRQADPREYPLLDLETDCVRSIVFERIGETSYLVMLTKSSFSGQGFFTAFKLTTLSMPHWKKCWIFPPEDHMLPIRPKWIQSFYSPFYMCKYLSGQILFCNTLHNAPETVTFGLLRTDLTGKTLHQLLSCSIEHGQECESGFEAPVEHAECKDILLKGHSMLSWNDKQLCVVAADTQSNVICKLSLKRETCDLPSCNVTSNHQELKMCSSCRRAAYCSKKHQKQHWKEHKKSCQRIILKTSHDHCVPVAKLPSPRTQEEELRIQKFIENSCEVVQREQSGLEGWKPFLPAGD